MSGSGWGVMVAVCVGVWAAVVVLSVVNVVAVCIWVVVCCWKVLAGGVVDGGWVGVVLLGYGPKCGWCWGYGW